MVLSRIGISGSQDGVPKLLDKNRRYVRGDRRCRQVVLAHADLAGRRGLAGLLIKPCSLGGKSPSRTCPSLVNINSTYILLRTPFLSGPARAPQEHRVSLQ